MIHYDRLITYFHDVDDGDYGANMIMMTQGPDGRRCRTRTSNSTMRSKQSSQSCTWRNTQTTGFDLHFKAGSVSFDLPCMWYHLSQLINTIVIKKTPGIDLDQRELALSMVSVS